MYSSYLFRILRSTESRLKGNAGRPFYGSLCPNIGTWKAISPRWCCFNISWQTIALPFTYFFFKKIFQFQFPLLEFERQHTLPYKGNHSIWIYIQTEEFFRFFLNSSLGRRDDILFYLLTYPSNSGNIIC